MVEVERVTNLIKDRKMSVKEIADALECSMDAVHNVLMLLRSRKTLYVSVGKGGNDFVYTIEKPIPSDEKYWK